MSGASVLQQAPAAAVPTPAPGLPLLQRACACGGSAGASGKCSGCETQDKLGSSLLQPKLTVSAPDDPYEREADAVADQVMRMPGPASAPPEVHPVVQREAAPEQEQDEEELAQRKPAGAAFAAPAGFAAALGPKSGGAALPAAARSFFEPRFGRDLGHVRIYDGASAAAMAGDINARAFTAGQDIYFASGQYDPASSAGRHLLAHELTHVVQQGGEGSVRRKATDGSPLSETEAPLPTADAHKPGAEAAGALPGEPGGGGAGDGPPPAPSGSPGDGSGAPLAAPARDFFEARLGRDLGHVRIHGDDRADALARGIGARAFTHGSHIYFARGEYDPGSPAGRHLLAHELVHTAQPERANVLRRVPLPARTAPAPAPAPSPAADLHGGASAPMQEIRPAAPATVLGITMSCDDMLMRVETAAMNYYYHMETCQLRIDDYSTSVSVSGNDFYLDFGSAVGADEEFEFSYRVEPNQQNPARLLEGQANVDVHVVDHLPAPTTPEEPAPAPPVTPECVVRLPDRELIPRDSYSTRLFEPIVVPPTTLWSQEIPLGWYGWVQVEATASADVSGGFNASYGPGTLSDICLTHLQDSSHGSAPITHPLLGAGSHADSSVYGIGGRARFQLPAQARVNLRATGRLRIAGDYLSVIELAAAEGSLTAEGSASLAGSIDASVDILARYARNSATLEAPLLPLSVTIEHSSFEAIDLSAAIGLRGRAALNFSLNGGAGFSVLGRSLWSQNWNLARFNAGVGWQGGLVYSPNPGLHWDLGEFGTLSDEGGGTESLLEAETLDDVEMHEDAAEFDGDELLPEIFEEEEAATVMPRGTPDDPLPFEWRKPDELYIPTVDLPRADSPPSVGRYDGPTDVSYFVRGRLQTETLGVADWPAVDKTFQYMPYDRGTRHTPQQAAFNRALNRLGFSRSGLDAEHVWDVKLCGLDYDRFDNLWPASNQEQQLAGVQHTQQIRAYERSRGSVNGLHFVIIGVRHPGEADR